MIKISVIIPVFNVERYLKRCLDSVLMQTIKEIEVICIDDGSEDHSYDILLEYQKKHENMIILRQENQGAGIARNYGIRKAAGKYLCFMDSDDYYAQDNALERLYMAAEENHASICGGNMFLEPAHGRKQRQLPWFSANRFVDFKDFGHTGSFQRYIFLAKLIGKNHILFPPYRRYQDPPFLMRAMICAQRFYEINEVVYIYRTEHKKVNYTLKKAVDLLCGIRECYEIARKYNLIITYKKSLEHILVENLGAFYRYAMQNQKAIWDLIEQICKIQYDWLGKNEEAFRNPERLEEYIARQRAAREKMLAACDIVQQIVIYGAGEAGKHFLQNYGKRYSNIIGFAVSRKEGNEDFIEGYAVREITAYNRDTLIIVAVSEQYADEVLDNLKRLQFKNICYVEYAILPFLEEE